MILETVFNSTICDSKQKLYQKRVTSEIKEKVLQWTGDVWETHKFWASFYLVVILLLSYFTTTDMRLFVKIITIVLKSIHGHEFLAPLVDCELVPTMLLVLLGSSCPQCLNDLPGRNWEEVTANPVLIASFLWTLIPTAPLFNFYFF